MSIKVASLAKRYKVKNSRAGLDTISSIIYYQTLTNCVSLWQLSTDQLA